MPDGSTWTLRLTVSDAARAQSTLTFNWPLDTDPGAAPFIPLFATDRERYGLGPLPDEPAAEAPVPVVAVPDKAAPVPVTGTIALPQPAVVSTPRVTPAPGPAVETKQKPPLPAPAVRVEARPVPKPTPAPTPKPKPKPVPQPRPTPAPKSAPKPQPQKNTGGIPSQMQINSSVPVTVVLRNTGTRSWSSQGASPVRLVYRWVDAKTGIRYRWALQWLREVVPPGGSTRLKFDLDAPPRAGNYILTYALVRLNWPTYDGKKYVPPASQAKDHRWPGEFGAVSFRITVAS
jgi:hypothetical protein